MVHTKYTHYNEREANYNKLSTLISPVLVLKIITNRKIHPTYTVEVTPIVVGKYFVKIGYKILANMEILLAWLAVGDNIILTLSCIHLYSCSA